MKISKIVLSAAVVAGLDFVGSVQGVHASVKPNFFVGRSSKGVWIKTTVKDVEFHVKAIKVTKHGYKKQISDGDYFTQPGKYYIAGDNDPVIGKNWKNSELYITKLSKKQMKMEDENNHYNSKGVKNTLVKQWY